jgi:hypothetical protein
MKLAQRNQFMEIEEEIVKEVKKKVLLDVIQKVACNPQGLIIINILYYL